MADRHSEIEIKFEADKVDTAAFCAWCMAKGATRYEYASSPDVYYSRGNNVVRHRYLGGAGELTVKLRKSNKSTTDRLEVDLRFAEDMRLFDITAFLDASGWKREFTLMKDCHIFWIEESGIEYSLVLYDASRLDEDGKLINKNKYLEIEIEKECPVDSNAAQFLLKRWKTEIERMFPVGKIINLSLYEIYSGKKYLTVK